jgi:hypothetical protein
VHISCVYNNIYSNKQPWLVSKCNCLSQTPILTTTNYLLSGFSVFFVSLQMKTEIKLKLNDQLLNSILFQVTFLMFLLRGYRTSIWIERHKKNVPNLPGYLMFLRGYFSQICENYNFLSSNRYTQKFVSSFSQRKFPHYEIWWRLIRVKVKPFRHYLIYVFRERGFIKGWVLQHIWTTEMNLNLSAIE